MYSWSNANNLKFTCYENGKRIVIYDVCQIARDYRTGNEWLNDLHTTNYELNRGYDLDSLIVFNLQWIYYFKEPLVVKVKNTRIKSKVYMVMYLSLIFIPIKFTTN